MADILMGRQDEPLIDRMSMLPIGQYADGSLTLAWPGMLKDAYEGAMRSYLDAGHVPVPDAPRGTRWSSDLDAFNAASIAPMAGVAGRAAGAVPRGALGSGGSDAIRRAEAGSAEVAGRLSGVLAPTDAPVPHSGGGQPGRNQFQSQGPQGPESHMTTMSDPLSGAFGLHRDTPEDEAVAILGRFLRKREGDLPEYLGLRVDDAPVARGDVFAPSRVWDDGVPTDELLSGTSGIRLGSWPEGISDDALAKAWRASQNYIGDRVRVIGSDYGEWGQDPGEFVFRNGRALFSNPTPASLPYLFSAPQSQQEPPSMSSILMRQ
jgi:hypothetical protein